METIFSIKDEREFELVALGVFYEQAKSNRVYAEYLKHLGTKASEVKSLLEIPFLPIEFFKTHQVISASGKPQTIFCSSGTTSRQTSRHYVFDLSFYKTCFKRIFEQFYGSVNDYCILALLPSYLERKDSSLVYMMEHLIRDSNHSKSGFYLYNYGKLKDVLSYLMDCNQKILLFGVSFALLEFAEKCPIRLRNTIVMETGGMKGRQKEIIREELHSFLCKRFMVKEIHSEYGMTELLSQAYSYGNGLFRTPPWMKILIRDPYDPFSYEEPGRAGGINVIDLANVDTCAFIETKDLGCTNPDGSFEVLGRFDDSDIRGCNLLA